MAYLSESRAAPAAGKGWTIGLWTAQVALAAMFGMAAYMKLLMTPEAMAAMGIAWATDAPVALIRFIGLAELAGTIGILAPALTRIQPQLTPLAALGFAAIQVLAFLFHLVRGEFAATPMNLVLLAVALFVYWGRTRKAPIAPRTA